MKKLLQRALPAWFGSAATAPAPAVAAAPPVLSAQTRKTVWRVGVRRPLISAAGEVVGFEFCLAAPILARHTDRSPPG